MRNYALVLFVCLGACLVSAWAAPATVYVNNRTGADTLDGRAATPAGDGKAGPVASIARALELVPVSGRVSIANTGTDYREALRVQRLHKGRAAAPLVIEGNGAAVTGLVTVPAARWTVLKDDVYWFENKTTDNPPKPGPMPNSNWLGFLRHQGWFTEPQAPEIFFLDGKTAPQVRELAAIAPGGFFYDTLANPRRLYFRLPAGKALADCALDVPLNTGVFVDDDYVVVRNLISRYSQDDGFAGFWGIGVVFENCNGSYNCDQGISLHGTSVTIIDGGLFERNGGAGIVDVMTSTTIYRNAVVRDNMIAGALLQGLAHSLISCRFSGNQGTQVGADKGAALNLTNCLVVGTTVNGKANGVSMERGRLDHCTIVECATGVAASKGGEVINCVLAKCTGSLVSVPAAALPAFRIGTTILAPGTLVLGERKVTAETWAEFAKTTPWAAGNILADPGLKPPLYSLPTDSPYLKAAQYDSTPGAVLKPWDGWRPTDEPGAVQPHP